MSETPPTNPPPTNPEPVIRIRPATVMVKLPPRFTPFTFIILGITTLVFIGQYFSIYQYGFDQLAKWGVKSNSDILNGEFWRLVTPVFLHGSIAHFGFNMYALFILGPSLERFYRPWRFLGLYFLSAICGNVISFLLSNNPSLGASTAIFGLITAEAVFLFKNRSLFGENANRRLMNIGLILVVNLIFGLSPNSGIDNWGHIGGLIGGLAFAWSAGPIMMIGDGPEGKELVDRRSPIHIGLTIFVILAVVTLLVVTRMMNP
jgi:rhomboid protease GluP